MQQKAPNMVETCRIETKEKNRKIHNVSQMESLYNGINGGPLHLSNANSRFG